MLITPSRGLNIWKWEMGNGKWEMGNGKWEMGNGKWEMGNASDHIGGILNWHAHGESNPGYRRERAMS
ncbi:unnamed protein product [Neisseria lactamica Y92-1009]|nr:unnamed protein product [Neisseria lactamica Y92-1009]